MPAIYVHASSRHILIRISVLISITTIISACVMPFQQLDALNDTHSGSGRHLNRSMITVESPSFMIAWDPPIQAVDSYEVYYRERGGSNWTLLAVTERPELSINSGLIPAGEGKYEFAVRSIYSDGELSDFHTSLSDAAVPRSWFLNWKPSS